MSNVTYNGAAEYIATIDAGLCTNCKGTGRVPGTTDCVDKDGKTVYCGTPEHIGYVENDMDCFECKGTGKASHHATP